MRWSQWLGETDRVFDWLETAYQQREPHVVHLADDACLDALRSDPVSSI